MGYSADGEWIDEQPTTPAAPAEAPAEPAPYDPWLTPGEGGTPPAVPAPKGYAPPEDNYPDITGGISGLGDTIEGAFDGLFPTSGGGGDSGDSGGGAGRVTGQAPSSGDWANWLADHPEVGYGPGEGGTPPAGPSDPWAMPGEGASPPTPADWGQGAGAFALPGEGGTPPWSGGGGFEPGQSQVTEEDIMRYLQGSEPFINAGQQAVTGNAPSNGGMVNQFGALAGQTGLTPGQAPQQWLANLMQQAGPAFGQAGEAIGQNPAMQALGQAGRVIGQGVDQASQFLHERPETWWWGTLAGDPVFGAYLERTAPIARQTPAGRTFSDWWEANRPQGEKTLTPDNPQTALDWALSVMQRGNYASANTAREVVRQWQANHGLDIGQLGQAALRGATGQEPRTYTDVLQALGMPEMVANPVGLGLDIVLDPTSYIGLGFLGKAGKGVGKVIEKAPVVGTLVDMLGNTFVKDFGLKAAGLGGFAEMANRYEKAKQFVRESSEALGKQVDKALTEPDRVRFWDLMDQGPMQWARNQNMGPVTSNLVNTAEAYARSYAAMSPTAQVSAAGQAMLAAAQRTKGGVIDVLPDRFRELYRWYSDTYEPGLRQLKVEMGLPATVDEYVHHFFPQATQVRMPEALHPWLPGSFKPREGAPVVLKDPGMSLAVDRAATLWAKETRDFLSETVRRFGQVVEQGAALSAGMSQWKLGGQTWAIPQEIATSLAHLNDPAQVKDILHLFDTVQSVWKASVTSLFPEFHLRNGIGNVVQNYLGGVVNPLNYVEAAAIQDVIRRYSLIPEAVKAATPRLQGNILQQVIGALPSKGADAIAERALKSRGITLDAFLDEAKRSGVIGSGWFKGEIGADLALKAGESRLAQLGQVAGSGAVGGATIGGAVGGAIGGPAGAALGAAGGVVAGPVISLLSLVGRGAGEAIENNAKIAHVLGRMNLGDNLGTAAKSAERFLFDYGDLSKFEQNVAKRAIPFYTWTRFAAPLIIERMINAPGRVVGIEKVRRTVEQSVLKATGTQPMTPKENENLQDYLAEQLNLQVGRNPKTGGPMIISGMGIPLEVLNLFYGKMEKPSIEAWGKRTLQKIGSMTTPLLGGVLQSMTGQSWYTGKPLAELDARNPNYRAAKWMYEIPQLREWLDLNIEKRYDKDGKPYDAYVANPEKMFWFMLPLGRFVRTGGKLGLGGEELNLGGAFAPYRLNEVRAASNTSMNEPSEPYIPPVNPTEPGAFVGDLAGYHLATSEPFVNNPDTQRAAGIYGWAPPVKKDEGNTIVVPQKDGTTKKYYLGARDVTDKYAFKMDLDSQLEKVWALSDKEVKGKTIREWENELYALPEAQQPVWRKAHPVENAAMNEKTQAKGRLLARDDMNLATGWYDWQDSKGYDTIREVTARLDMPKFEQFYLETALRSAGDKKITAPTAEGVAAFTGAPVGTVAGAGAKSAAATPTANVPGATVGAAAVSGITAESAAQLEAAISGQLDTRPDVPKSVATFRGAYYAKGADREALERRYPQDAAENTRILKANEDWAKRPENAEAADYLEWRKTNWENGDTTTANMARYISERGQVGAIAPARAVSPMDPMEMWAAGLGGNPEKFTGVAMSAPPVKSVPVAIPPKAPAGPSAPRASSSTWAPRASSYIPYAPRPEVGTEAAALTAKVNGYYNFGTPEQKALVDKYMAMDTYARAAFRSNSPAEYKAFQSVMDARDAMAKGDPELTQFLQFNKAMAPLERPAGIKSDVEWFLQAKNAGLLSAIIGNLKTTTTTPYVAAPKRGGGGGGGGYKAPVKSGAATGTMGAFVAEAGQGLISDLVKYWGQGQPLTQPATDFLKALYGKYSFGARSYEEWLAYVLRSQWALWNISNPGGTAAIPAVPVAVPA